MPLPAGSYSFEPGFSDLEMLMLINTMEMYASNPIHNPWVFYKTSNGCGAHRMLWDLNHPWTAPDVLGLCEMIKAYYRVI